MSSGCHDAYKMQQEMKEERKQYDRSKVVQNYYKASTALMEIGTAENISDELRQLAINASSATMKIIDYINSHKD